MRTRRLRLAFQVHPRLFGGQERFVMRLLDELRWRGHECLVISSPAGSVLTEFEKSGFESLRLSGRDFASDRHRLAKMLRSRNIDVAQTNLYSPLLALCASAAGVPHVWRVGGHPDLALHDEPRATREALVRLNRALSATVVCNSRFVAARLRGLGASAPRVIYNGVPIPEASPPSPSIGVAGRGNVALLAHFYPQKRHQDFIRAAAAVHRRQPDTRFRIYGSTLGLLPLRRHRERMKNLAERLGLRRVLSFSSAASIDRAVPWSDIVVLPTIGESCSNALLEAMAAGRAVVAARSGGNTELVVDAVRGRLFAPKDWRGLSSILTELVREPGARHRLGLRAAARVKAHHSMESCADAYERVYQSLLGPEGGGTRSS